MSKSTGVTSPEPVHRVVTGHDERGSAVYLHDDHPPSTSYYQKPGMEAKFTVVWGSDGFPVDCQTGKDGALSEVGELIKADGTVVRYVDFPPETDAPMHRTQSLDYGIVIYGELEIVLDNGATKTIRQSDIVVQQGTIHAWRNKTDKYARMVFILISAKPVLVDGKPLEDVSIH